MRFSFQNVKNLTNLISEISVGLNKLDFINNFESFEVQVEIPPVTVLRIRNELPSIPNRRIIARQDAEANISDSATEWSKDFVYLENHHATNTVILTVIFLR